MGRALKNPVSWDFFFQGVPMHFMDSYEAQYQELCLA